MQVVGLFPGGGRAGFSSRAPDGGGGGLAVAGGGGGSSEPTPSDTIILNMLPGGGQDIQSIANMTQFRAPFQALGGDWPVGGGSCTSSFVTDYDGAGTHAVRIDWTQQGPGIESANNGCMAYFISTPLDEIFTTRVQHLGKTSAGGGIGSVGVYTPVTDDGGSKRMMWMRTHDNNTDRVYLNYPTGGQANKQQDFAIDARTGGGSFDDFFNCDWLEGQSVRWTERLKRASSNGAADGILQVWRNGVLVHDNQSATIGSLKFEQVLWITTRFAVSVDASEYWTKIAVWGKQ